MRERGCIGDGIGGTSHSREESISRSCGPGVPGWASNHASMTKYIKYTLPARLGTSDFAHGIDGLDAGVAPVTYDTLDGNTNRFI